MKRVQVSEYNIETEYSNLIKQFSQILFNFMEKKLERYISPKLQNKYNQNLKWYIFNHIVIPLMAIHLSRKLPDVSNPKSRKEDLKNWFSLFSTPEQEQAFFDFSAYPNHLRPLIISNDKNRAGEGLELPEEYADDIYEMIWECEKAEDVAGRLTYEVLHLFNKKYNRFSDSLIVSSDRDTFRFDFREKSKKVA